MTELGKNSNKRTSVAAPMEEKIKKWHLRWFGQMKDDQNILTLQVQRSRGEHP